MKIITIRQHFPNRYHPNSSYWVYEQVKDLSSIGFSFKVISPQPYIPKPVRSRSKYPEMLPLQDNVLGVSVIRPVHLRIPKYKFYGFTNWFLNRAVYGAGKSLKADVIHAHFGNDGIASLKLKRKLNIPLITSFYGYDLSDQLCVLEKFYGKLIREGDLFLALSDDMKNDLIKIGFPEEKIIIHHLGINFESVANYSVIEKTDNTIVFLIVARFIERKGIHDAITAFAKLCQVRNNVHLNIVGNGEYSFALRELVDKLEIQSKITFIDNFITKNPRDTALKYIASCDIFLLTSYSTQKGSKEGTPIVLMEAQGMGKPCIATDHAGIPEIVKDGTTGLIVNERDVEAMYLAMLTLYDDYPLRKKYGEKAKDFIEQEFNNVVQQKKLAKIYKTFQ